MAKLRESLSTLKGKSFAGHVVESAEDFAYVDPVDGSVSEKQGVKMLLSGDTRIVYRLSGTGTAGATLRVYVERYEPDPRKHDVPTQTALASAIVAADEIAGIRATLGVEPSAIT